MNDLSAQTISQIIEEVKRSDFTELRMAYRGLELWVTRREGGFDVRTIQKWTEPGENDTAAAVASTATPVSGQPPASAEAPPAGSQTAPSATQGHGTGHANVSNEDLIDVPSPMLGTFYVAPEPGKEPFVKVGSKVEADSVVAIVEAMKLLTRVNAGVAGEVVEVLVKNDTLVEFGQPLFRIRPA